MKRSHLFIMLGCLILLSASPAHANMGTPLMWAGNFQLTLGNIIIGLLEGFLILLLVRSRIDAKTRIQRSAAPWIMILANFVSGLVGILLSALLTFNGALNHGASVNTSDLKLGLYLTGIILFLYLLTALIEWPFCHWVLNALRYKDLTARRSLSVSLIVQCTSYILLIIMYYAASDITIFTRLHSDPSLSFVRNPKSEVYFISESDGDVYKIRLDGTDQQKVFDVEKDNPTQSLFLWNVKGDKLWKLGIGNRERKGETTLIESNFAEIIPPSDDWNKKDTDGKWPRAESYAMDMRPLNSRNLRINTDYFANSGLQIYDEAMEKNVNFGLETPFVQWESRYATVLPGDQVVYQLGKQIVILDLNSRRIGLIAYGRSPVVRLSAESPQVKQ
ncbi:MAG: hypothetical protein ACYC0V_18485 [Armatimonadota bacterium]